MKKIVKFAASLLFIAGAMISCQKENFTQELDSNVPTSFTASFEQTKVSIDGFTPVFEQGDVLHVKASNGATADFTFDSSAEGGQASFKIKGSWSATPAAPYFVYSGSLNMDFFGSNMAYFNIPNLIQTPFAGKINDLVMVDKVNDLSTGVMLKNECALLKFTVSEDVKNVQFNVDGGKNPKVITVNFVNFSAMPAGSNAPYFQVGLGSLPAGTYYVPFSPSYPSYNGIKAGVTTDGVTYTWKEKEGTFTFERNKIYDLGDVKDWKPAPAGPTAADFAGTYTGNLSEIMGVGETVYGTKTSSGDEYVFEADGDALVMKKYCGKACNVAGTFNSATATATFSSGEVSVYQGTGNIMTPLVLTMSKDGDNVILTQTGRFDVQPSGMPFIWGGTLTNLVKQEVGPTPGPTKNFPISIMTDNQWVVSYKANGVAKTETSGSNTTFQKQAEAAAASTGCNLYISYFMCGYNTGYANLNEETGAFTIPKAKNSGALYWPAIDWVAKDLTSDIVMQISEDKSKVVATASFTLSDGTVISDYTFTKAN